MCLLHLVASLPTNPERIQEGTKKTTNLNSLLKHSTYDRKQEKKEERPTNQLGITSQKGKNREFFFSGTICAQFSKASGEAGEQGGLVGCGTSRC